MFKYVFLATRKGTVKKTSKVEFENIRRSGIVAIKLDRDDELVWSNPTTGDDDILVYTRNGKCIRFNEKAARPLGRATRGVRGIRISGDDLVVGMDVVKKAENPMLLTIMENGFGKKTLLKFYKKQRRGGSGVKTAKITPKTGAIVAAFEVQPETKEIIAISKRGTIIRVSLDSISTVSRVTQGVRIMRVEPGDKVVSATLL